MVTINIWLFDQLEKGAFSGCCFELRVLAMNPIGYNLQNDFSPPAEFAFLIRAYTIAIFSLGWYTCYVAVRGAGKQIILFR